MTDLIRAGILLFVTTYAVGVLSQRIGFYRLLKPAFILDIRSYLRCTKSQSYIRIQAMLWLVLFAAWWPVTLFIYFPWLNLCHWDILVWHIPLPVVLHHNIFLMASYYVFFPVVNFIWLNQVSKIIVPHSELARRVARAILILPKLPDEFEYVRQVSPSRVVVRYRDGSLVSEFRSELKRIETAGGLDVHEIDELRHGEIAITCERAHFAGVDHFWFDLENGGLRRANGQQWFLYFWEDDGRNLIRVGHSTDPEKRMRSHRSSNLGVRLLACVPETSELNEGTIKMDFSEEHVEGEFYKKSERLMGIIESIKTSSFV